MGKVRLEVQPWLSDILGAKGVGPLILEEEILDGATLGDLLRKLTAEHQALEEVLFAPATYQLSGPVSIVINGQLSQSLQELDTVLKDGDTVMFLPFIDGG